MILKKPYHVIIQSVYKFENVTGAMEFFVGEAVDGLEAVDHLVKRIDELLVGGIAPGDGLGRDTIRIFLKNENEYFCKIPAFSMEMGLV